MNRVKGGYKKKKNDIFDPAGVVAAAMEVYRRYGGLRPPYNERILAQLEKGQEVKEYRTADTTHRKAYYLQFGAVFGTCLVTCFRGKWSATSDDPLDYSVHFSINGDKRKIFPFKEARTFLENPETKSLLYRFLEFKKADGCDKNMDVAAEWIRLTEQHEPSETDRPMTIDSRYLYCGLLPGMEKDFLGIRQPFGEQYVNELTDVINKGYREEYLSFTKEEQTNVILRISSLYGNCFVKPFDGKWCLDAEDMMDYKLEFTVKDNKLSFYPFRQVEGFLFDDNKFNLAVAFWGIRSLLTGTTEDLPNCEGKERFSMPAMSEEMESLNDKSAHPFKLAVEWERPHATTPAVQEGHDNDDEAFHNRMTEMVYAIKDQAKFPHDYGKELVEWIERYFSYGIKDGFNDAEVADRNTKIMSWGTAFGQCMVEAHGARWIPSDDEENLVGSRVGLVIQGLTLLVYPYHVIAKYLKGEEDSLMQTFLMFDEFKKDPGGFLDGLNVERQGRAA
ncbi:hypothetical protein [Polluticoccus soli]|uniref:hypothetical protein n=1 Tax=Polluticoccus soli TaxID=3034150 RepID=UPI0023E2A3E5|nr:hypothetical protein [Flavipsychrobacter sp. JY13-12]